MKSIQLLKVITVVLLIGGLQTALAADVAAPKAKKAGPQLTDLSKPIAVTSKQPIIRVVLKANPSTGFSWYLESYNRNLVTPLSARYFPPDKAMPGAPGYMVWRFHINGKAFVVPQVTSINIVYARPWELDNVKPQKMWLVIQ